MALTGSRGWQVSRQAGPGSAKSGTWHAARRFGELSGGIWDFPASYGMEEGAGRSALSDFHGSFRLRDRAMITARATATG